MNKFKVPTIEEKVEEFINFQGDITPQQYEYCLMLVNREAPHFNVILKLQEARNMFKYSEYIEEELRARHGPFPLVNLRYSHKRRYVCMGRKLVEKKELSKM